MLDSGNITHVHKAVQWAINLNLTSVSRVVKKCATTHKYYCLCLFSCMQTSNLGLIMYVDNCTYIAVLTLLTLHKWTLASKKNTFIWLNAAPRPLLCHQNHKKYQ